VLEEKGMMVVIAENGKEALKRLKNQEDIDLVLMDIMMPEMDGYETMQQIRQDPKFRKLPIIALTAKAMKGDRQRCIDAGANDYLPKPIHIDKLFSLLRIWLY
jgi:CheY-like chemotaxis protein